VLWSCCCLLAATLCCYLSICIWLAVPFSESGFDLPAGFCYWLCWVWLLWLPDSTIGFAWSGCWSCWIYLWVLLDSGPCSCWIGFLVCGTFVGPLFGWVLIVLTAVFYRYQPLFLVGGLYIPTFGPCWLDSGSVWFCLAWFVGFHNFPLSPVFYHSSWVCLVDCVSLSPLRLPHPQGACNQSFVHHEFVRFWHPSHLP